jgi:hypothetical protein
LPGNNFGKPVKKYVLYLPHSAPHQDYTLLKSFCLPI